MTFGNGESRPEIHPASASKRTFYIERTGDSYQIVKVIEAGTRMDHAMMESLIHRGFTSSPDERVIAEQIISIVPADRSSTGEVQIITDTPENAAYTLHGIDKILRGGRIVD